MKGNSRSMVGGECGIPGAGEGGVSGAGEGGVP